MTRTLHLAVYVRKYMRMSTNSQNLWYEKLEITGHVWAQRAKSDIVISSCTRSTHNNRFLHKIERLSVMTRMTLMKKEERHPERERNDTLVKEENHLKKERIATLEKEEYYPGKWGTLPSENGGMLLCGQKWWAAKCLYPAVRGLHNTTDFWEKNKST